MAVVKCSKNGLLALICDKILRVYDLKASKLVHKYSFCGESKTESSTSDIKNEEGQFVNVTFSYGCAFSNSGKFLAAFSDSKDVLVWQTGGDWKQIGHRKVPKRPTAVLFTNKEDKIVISDKAGDVYSYSIANRLSDETLVLGHVSMILDMVISKDDRHIVTADRDEKIRVSRFPNAYNIETFFLGHEEYVFKLMLLETLPDILVSASGDGTIWFWNLKLGKAIHELEFEERHLNKSDCIVSCLTCSKTKNIVFVGLKGSCSLYVVEVTSENEVQSLLSAGTRLDAPPCCLAVAHNDYLWVVQSDEEHPVVVFEIKVEDGNYRLNRLPHSNISPLMSAEGWDQLYDGLKQMPCLENLKRKDGQGELEYYNRKKDRIEAKRQKDANLDDKHCITTKKMKT